MSKVIFKLPDLGEGLPDAEIAEWHVKVGDEIKMDQLLVSMETAKAVVEVPSPYEGRVVNLFGKPGDIINTGGNLIEFETDKNVVEDAHSHAHSQSHSHANAQAHSNAHSHSEAQTQSHSQSLRNNAATAAGELEIGNTVLQEPTLTFGNRPGSNAIKATPAIRALAQQMKVDLSTVTPTGPNGTIMRQDIEHAAALLQQAGPLELLKGVRRAMAQSMSQANAEIVPVTIMDDAVLIKWSKDEDITVRVVQAIAHACQVEPALNAWFDGKVLGRRLLKEVHLGIAVDSPEGLFVPVIRNANTLSGSEIRERLNTLKKNVLDRSMTPHDFHGATFTLSNFGIFAGRYANPVIVPPMVAILASGKIVEEVKAVEGKMQICRVMPLSLTFDHRAVTGGEASRFLGAVIEALQK